MEWLMMNPQVQGTFASLGSVVGDTYVASPNCLETLNEMVQKMLVEDRTLRNLRRAIGFAQVVKKDLVPLLINIKDDRKITDTIIKVLADLTTPVECLLPIEVMSKSEAGRNTIIELKWLLISCKETFLDPRGTRRIIDHIRDILYKGDKLEESDCETLNDCVILLRNILHIPDSMINVAEGFSEQNQILWNLFAHNFDKVLIEMITGPRRKEWRIAMAQLVVLLYKDQRVATLQKLLNLWMESGEWSESSEDNESNTSPPEEESFSSMVTSDPTSDSSDNSGTDRKPEMKIPGKRKQSLKQPHIKKQEEKQSSWGMRATDSGEQKMDSGCSSWGGVNSSDSDQKMDCSSSKISDCGYGTHQESISTSSFEDDAPNRVHMKALLHHTPTKDDISQLLKEFTVDFLLKAYNTLVSEMRHQLVMDSSLDRTHFSWLIAYFLKFAVQMELDLQHIRGILSYEIISFLAYEGAILCEQFEILSSQSECDLSTNLRKVHLVITAIREILQTVNAYKRMKHLSESDIAYLIALQKELSEMEDLRCLFVALLRQFNSQVHSKPYLRDLIVTNHILLTFIENSSLPDPTSLLQTHIKQFVPVEMMRQYGYLLECYKENDNFVNNCVFTMMHHVAGDLEHVSALFQPTILKTFSLIWENEFQICDDWSDLIEYVIHKFVSTPQTCPSILERKFNVTLPGQREAGWNEEESGCLYWYYLQSANCPDPIGNILDLYSDSGVGKSRIGIIEKLLCQDVITNSQYKELMEKESIPSTDMEKYLEEKKSLDEIDILKNRLLKDDKLGSGFVVWLQKVLLETCYAKTFLSREREHNMEPLPYYSIVLQEAVPLVPWSVEQKALMESQEFLLLLHKLGLQLPAELGKVFARIPSSWPPQLLFSKALRLGPISKDWDKFKMFSNEYFEENSNE